MLWQLFTNCFYNIVLRTPRFILNDDNKLSAEFQFAFEGLVFVLSPLAGYVADARYGRVKVLLSGTYMMAVSLFLFITFGLILYSNVHTFNTAAYILLSLLFLSSLLYLIGYVLFTTNIIQFVTDQLRDAPTRYSVLLIYAYMWTDSVGNIIGSLTNLPGHKIIINKDINVISMDKFRFIITTVVLVSSLVLLTVLLHFIHKYKGEWFTQVSFTHNPYKSFYRIVLFAFHHKQPIRRSAFTFCDDQRPTRLDFCKKRFGGPFTTEQVEDIKVTLNILKVLFALGPIFFLEGAAYFTLTSHKIQHVVYFKVQKPVLAFFTGYGIVEPLSSVVCIPLYLLAVKPLLVKCQLNLFKRMGLASMILTTFFLVFLMYDIFFYQDNYNFHTFNFCLTNATYPLNERIINLPMEYIIIPQQILFSFYNLLLHIAAYEFICCQSPQYMKGLLLGLFYSLKGVFHLLSAIIMVMMYEYWNSTLLSCHSFFYLLSLCIGSASIVFYIITARKYKYRKRDDICNFHRFAEEYYFFSHQ